MESPRKFNDCYFYYYSTCTKGDNCVFRHEPSALGCETMCVQWQQGKCLDKRCKLRHMELRKNRKQIPCYWESQPGGCRKKHCPFQHKNPEARTDGIAPSQPVPLVKNSSAGAVSCVEAEPAMATVPAPHPAPHAPQAPGMVMPHQLLWQQPSRQVVLDSAILGVMPTSELMGRRVPPAPHDPASVPPYAPIPVDQLVVNFEEESDNESAPSSTPTKMVSPDEGPKVASSKTQELILLEQIQAEAAAYYSYDADVRPLSVEPALMPERRTVRTNLNSQYERLSLDEISGRPRTADHIRRNSLDFKILSLDEIRARKRVSEPQVITTEQNVGKKRKLSTHEAMLAPDKVIKVVRSNSLVYKKVDSAGSASTEKSVPEHSDNSRKRTHSDESDVFIINDEDLDEGVTESTNLPHSKIRKLDDQCQEIKLKLICSVGESDESNICDTKVSDLNLNVEEASVVTSSVIMVDDDTADIDLDIEVVEGDARQPIIVSDEDSLLEIVTSDRQCDKEAVEIPSKNNVSHVIKILEDGSNDSITPEIENSLKSGSVPDVVASCHGDKYNVKIDQEGETTVLIEIDDFLNEDSL